MFYYYCPNCKYEDKIEKIPCNAVGNIRDGYGWPIHHFECPVCHNLDAGAIIIKDDDEDERSYYQAVIGLYQNIRGFKDVKILEVME